MCCSDQIVKHQFADLTRTTLSEFSRHRGWSVSLENGFQIFTPLVVSIKVIQRPDQKEGKLKRYFVYFFILSPRHGFVKITHKLLETGISTLDIYETTRSSIINEIDQGLLFLHNPAKCRKRTPPLKIT